MNRTTAITHNTNTTAQPTPIANGSGSAISALLFVVDAIPSTVVDPTSPTLVAIVLETRTVFSAESDGGNVSITVFDETVDNEESVGAPVV